MPEAAFVVFVAAAAEDIADAVLLRFAQRMVDAGVAAVSSWGPGCRRVEDAFDSVWVAEQPGDKTLLTTADVDEPLDEALWSGLTAPVGEGFEDPETALFVVIGNDDWAEYVRSRLRAPEQLDAV